MRKKKKKKREKGSKKGAKKTKIEKKEREREEFLYLSFGRKPKENQGELTHVLRELSMADNETSSFSSKVVAPSRPTIGSVSLLHPCLHPPQT